MRNGEAESGKNGPRTECADVTRNGRTLLPILPLRNDLAADSDESKSQPALVFGLGSGLALRSDASDGDGFSRER
jgi:hypothetical protein